MELSFNTLGDDLEEQNNNSAEESKTCRKCTLKAFLSFMTCALLALNWILSFLRDMSNNEELMRMIWTNEEEETNNKTQ
jgi:hypothetical protein